MRATYRPPDEDDENNWRENLLVGDSNNSGPAVMKLVAELHSEGAVPPLQLTYKRRTEDSAIVYTPMASSDFICDGGASS